MSIPQAVYKWHTFVPVRFSRVADGPPNAVHPDPDDRGYRDTEHGAVLGVTAGDTVQVAVRRIALDESADLWVTSTDPSIISVSTPDGGHLPAGARAVIHVEGHRGAGRTPLSRNAKLQARFGSSSGPILGELLVKVYRRLSVDVTPHMVTIRGAGGAVGSVADVATIMRMVRAVWRPCGIAFNVLATRTEDVTFATAGIVMDTPWDNTHGAANAEIARLLNTHYNRDTINVYFVHQIGTRNTLGYGFSRSIITAPDVQLPNPGIILGDTTAAGDNRNTQWWANDLAHEIGHFLTLAHSGNIQAPNELEDSWARRMLMHPFNLMWGHDPWPRDYDTGIPFNNRPLANNVGYGADCRGCLITQKDLPQVQMDDECRLARDCAGPGGSGPY